MRAVFRTHSARRDACALASGAGVDIIAVAMIAEESPLTPAIGTPIGIIDHHFRGFVSKFMHIAGVVAVYGTRFRLITGTVTFVAMLKTRTAASDAFGFRVVSVEYVVALAGALGTKCSSHAAAHMAGSLARTFTDRAYVVGLAYRETAEFAVFDIHVYDFGDELLGFRNAVTKRACDITFVTMFADHIAHAVA